MKLSSNNVSNVPMSFMTIVTVQTTVSVARTIKIIKEMFTLTVGRQCVKAVIDDLI